MDDHCKNEAHSYLPRYAAPLDLLPSGEECVSNGSAANGTHRSVGTDSGRVFSGLLASCTAGVVGRNASQSRRHGAIHRRGAAGAYVLAEKLTPLAAPTIRSGHLANYSAGLNSFKGTGLGPCPYTRLARKGLSSNFFRQR